MISKSKKIIGTSLVGLMTVLGVAGTLVSSDDIKSAHAEANAVIVEGEPNTRAVTYASAEVELASSMIERTKTSLRANYLGLKNVPQWQIYIRDARALTAKIVPGSTRDTFNARIDAQEQVVNTVISLGQLENSMENNAHVVRNIPQWTDYVNTTLNNIRLIHSDYTDLKDKLKVRLTDKVDVMIGILKANNVGGNYDYQIYELEKIKTHISFA